jgi:hypothetical protein
MRLRISGIRPAGWKGLALAHSDTSFLVLLRRTAAPHCDGKESEVERK